MDNPIAISLFDMDGMLLCDPCVLRGAPPHGDKYRRILPKDLSSETVVIILVFAFEAIAEFEEWERFNRM